jgi:hypothetical protein
VQRVVEASHWEAAGKLDGYLPSCPGGWGVPERPQLETCDQSPVIIRTDHEQEIWGKVAEFSLSEWRKNAVFPEHTERNDMMKLKVREVGKGFHPMEVLVQIRGIEGERKMLIDRRSLNGGYVSVGNPISNLTDRLLVELPRETTVGEWRVWVPRDEVDAA